MFNLHEDASDEKSKKMQNIKQSAELTNAQRAISGFEKGVAEAVASAIDLGMPKELIARLFIKGAVGVTVLSVQDWRDIAREATATLAELPTH